MEPPINKSTFRAIVWRLAIAQTLVWAAIFYAFPALLPTWEQELGWSKTTLSGALTVALLVSALCAPLAGRIIDRGQGAYLFAGSAILGAVSLALLAGVGAVWQFYVLYVLLGGAMAGTLYEPCFAILTRTMGVQRKRAIITVTLVAGFAGTISFPGNHALLGVLGWRGTVLVLAGIVAFVVTPLLWSGARLAEANRQVLPAPAGNQSNDISHIIRRPVFWLLLLLFAALALNHGVLLTHILPLLADRGLEADTAVLAASLIGPMQVLGRLLLLVTEQRLSSLVAFIVCGLAVGLASLALVGATTWLWLVGGFVLLQGAGHGATSILRPVVTADLLGERNFGVISGLLAVPFQAASAAAPTIAALVWGVGGYDWVIIFALVAAGVGVVALVSAVWIRTLGL